MAERRPCRPKPGFWGWLNQRLPVDVFLRSQLTEYYAPKNFNFWYFFGSLALLVLVMQLVTGIFLTMFYKVGENTAFDSVEFIMREVDFGWLLRYLHSTGASAFFLVVYLHMYRGMHVRLVQDPARAAVAVRHDHLPGAHGRGLHGLRAAVGQHVLLGRHGDHQPVRHDPGHRPGAGRVDSRRLRHRRCHAEPLLLAARRGGAAGAAVAGGAAPGGVARGGFQQSRRRRDQGQEGRTGHAARRHTVPSLLHRQGHRRYRGIPDAVLASWCSAVPTFGDLFLEKANFEPANPLSTPDPISPSWYFTPYYAILRVVPEQEHRGGC